MWKKLIYQGKLYDFLSISDTGELMNDKTNTIYKQTIMPTGYKAVCVSLGSRKDKKLFRIHKCVAETFLDNSKELKEINHIDGNKCNNNVSNLEWCTHSENIEHAYKNGLIDISKVSGEKCKWSKLKSKDVEFIRYKYKPFDLQYGIRALARMFNVSKGAIEYIVHNKSWKNNF